MAKKTLAINLVVDEEFVNMGAAMVGKMFTSTEEFNKVFFDREKRVDVDLAEIGDDKEASMFLAIACSLAILAHDEADKTTKEKKESPFMTRLKEAQKIEEKARKKKQ